jgi:predicted secreted acid phosphatase
MNDYKEWSNALTEISKDIIRRLDRLKLSSNSAIVFDIDETLLDRIGKPITQIILVYNYSKMIGLTPIIITSRPGFSENVKATQKQLLNNMICDYRLLFFLPLDRYDSFIYKKLSRKCAVDKGFDIVMSIGDQKWDIGEYGGIGVILPRYVGV